TGDGLGHCPPGLNPKLSLRGPTGEVSTSDNTSAGNGGAKIDPVAKTADRNLPVVTYAATVEFLGNCGATPFYVLEAKVNPPGCGDGILQAGEQCDDGNLKDGDGCSATCTLEAS